MKIDEAKALIQGKDAGGFRVSFERRENGMLYSDFFPDRGEKPFKNETEALMWAVDFSRVDPSKYVNIYVISAKTFVPVAGMRKFNAHPARYGEV